MVWPPQRAHFMVWMELFQKPRFCVCSVASAHVLAVTFSPISASRSMLEIAVCAFRMCINVCMNACIGLGSRLVSRCFRRLGWRRSKESEDTAHEVLWQNICYKQNLAGETLPVYGSVGGEHFPPSPLNRLQKFSAPTQLRQRKIREWDGTMGDDASVVFSRTETHLWAGRDTNWHWGGKLNVCVYVIQANSY